MEGAVDGDAARVPFVPGVATIAAVALGLRVGYVLQVTRHDRLLYDAIYYELQARTIADGYGLFTDPFSIMRGIRDVQAADHPPLTALLLVPLAMLGTSQLGMRFFMALLGTATVVLVAFLARSLAGPTVGLVAAGIAAVDPNLWANDGLIMSEPPGVLLVTVLLLGAYSVVQRGSSWRWAVGLGMAAGLGVLTRVEFTLLALVLVVPALVVGASGDRRRALLATGIAGAVALTLVAPWVAFNLSRFEEPTLLSTNDGMALRAGNCPTTYHGPLLGWGEVFPPCTKVQEGAEQSVMSARNRDDAMEYIGDNLDRLPVVAAARLGRSWSVFNIRQTARFAAREGRPTWVTYLGAGASWLLVPLAVVGGRDLRRRGRRIWPLVTVIATVNLVVAFLAAGALRYRASAETAMVVLAATGLAALLRRRRDRLAAAPV